MRILLTRPLGDAEETAALLSARGHEIIAAPLLDIRTRAGAEIVLDGIQAVLTTSANGIRALARLTHRRDMKILAVGAQSAEAAHALGFTAVEHAGGDAAALAALAAQRLKPENGALLHVSGAQTRGALVENLVAKGFVMKSAVLYDAAAADRLPADAAAALAEGRLDAALFYSPRTAEVFVTLVKQAGLENACRDLVALCISEAAAGKLSGLAFRAIRVAARPDRESLFALLD